jgi:hypothetical protein
MSPYAAIGFGTYSDGVVDDVNKNLWSVLGWNPNAALTDSLVQYARWFVFDGTAGGVALANSFAQSVMALEKQWIGPVTSHVQDIEQTLSDMQTVYAQVPVRARLNWRLHSALFRAVFDSYVCRRLLYEQALQTRALQQLAEYAHSGPVSALRAANQTLSLAVSEPIATDALAQLWREGEALWQSIHLKLSVQWYGAVSIDRGAVLDTVSTPLTNAPYLQQRFATLLATTNQTQQVAGIQQLLTWQQPCGDGAEVYYDDLGQVSAQPHLINHDPVFAGDPSCYTHSVSSTSSGVSAAALQSVPLSWRTYAEALYDAPVSMRYTQLTPTRRYAVRAVYWGDDVQSSGGITLYAANPLNSSQPILIHPSLQPPTPPQPLQFDVPAAALSAQGVLQLSWYAAPDRGGSGRGCQIAEVWLLPADCALPPLEL